MDQKSRACVRLEAINWLAEGIHYQKKMRIRDPDHKVNGGMMTFFLGIVASYCSYSFIAKYLIYVPKKQLLCSCSNDERSVKTELKTLRTTQRRTSHISW